MWINEPGKMVGTARQVNRIYRLNSSNYFDQINMDLSEHIDMHFRPVMLVKTVLAWCLVLSCIGDASATSCTSYSQRYFILCDVDGCKAAFSVLEVPAFSGCNRRPVVDEIDAQAGAYLGKLVTKVYSSDARGLYLLKLSSRYWDSPKSSQFDRLMDELQETLPFTSEGERCKPREMSVAEIGRLLKKQDAKGSLVLVTKEMTPQAVEAKRAVFESEEKYEHLRSILLAFGYWASSVIALLALIHSVHLFFFRLYDQRRKGSSVLLLPVATQLAIAAIGVGAVMLYPSGFWPGSLMVPAAVVVLFCEGWARYRFRLTAASA